MGSIQELQKKLRIKDQRITELENLVRDRDEQLQELRSQLDKYQSIMPPSPTTASFSLKGPGRKRNMGISAEPAAQFSIKDFSTKTFRKYAKQAQ